MISDKKKRLERIAARIGHKQDQKLDRETEALIDAFVKEDAKGVELIKEKFRAKYGRAIGYKNGQLVREEPDQAEINRLDKLLKERLLAFSEDYCNREV